MATIETTQITINGRKKIVNADDPRAQAAPKKKMTVKAKATVAKKPAAKKAK